MWLWAVITAVALTVELVGEGRDHRVLIWLGKPIASTAFIAAALHMGATGSAYGQTVLVALVFSWFGDVLLIPKGARGPFLAGLVSFLLGHVAYAVAFVVHGVDTMVVAITAAALVVPVTLIGRWLLPKVRAGMKAPVLAYMLVISAMVVLAVGTGRPLLMVAAGLFYVSDLAVARERFVQSSIRNRQVGLPLYFAAQLLFAASV